MLRGWLTRCGFVYRHTPQSGGAIEGRRYRNFAPFVRHFSGDFECKADVSTVNLHQP
jgi:hypothetical protein